MNVPDMKKARHRFDDGLISLHSFFFRRKGEDQSEPNAALGKHLADQNVNPFC